MGMTDRRNRMPERAGGESMERMLDAYVGWREECGTLRSAYGRWHGAVRRERRLAFAAYLAALDREERAAAVYHELVLHSAGQVGGTFARGPDWPTELLMGT
jgi:hypothetical protein